MRRKTPAFAFLFPCLALNVGLSFPCFARDIEGENLYSFQIENDTFVKGASTDEWYTNGVRFSWSPIKCKFDFPFDDSIIGLLGAGLVTGAHVGIRPMTYFVGQSMYTPSDIEDPNPQPNDRPWAGWLYVGKKYQVIGKAGGRPVLKSLEGSIGVLGHRSLAEQTQKAVHEIVPAPTPLGWNNQIGGRMTLSLNYLEKRKYGSDVADAIFEYGGNVGNVMNYLNSGLALRIGRNLCDFGVSPMPVTVQNELDHNPAYDQAEDNSDRHKGCDDPAAQKDLSFYGFAGFGVKAVASNVFIEGEPKNGTSNIDLRPFVYDLNAGLAIRKGSWGFSYVFVRRSREFDGGAEHPHKFGAITFSW